MELFAYLKKFDFVNEIWQSAANFILLRVSDARELVDWCAGRGIRIRDFSSQPQLEGCVRLTIGSSDELAELKTALQAYEEQWAGEGT